MLIGGEETTILEEREKLGQRAEKEDEESFPAKEN